MNRDKQIEEMAKLICTYPQCIHHNIIDGCANTECQTVDIAENLYKQGYRKASEVAKEIFEEIDALIDMLCAMTGLIVIGGKYTELKAKYIGKDTNVTTNTEGER